MKAMILAAGRGERMRPLTEHTPKPLLEVCGKPLIVHHIERLREAGFEELVINTGWLGSRIREALGDGRTLGVSIRYSIEPERAPLETAGGIAHALPLLGDEPFLVVNADVWTDYAPRPQWRWGDDLAHLLLVPNPPHHPQGDFALGEDGRLHAEGAPRLTYAGIGWYRPQAFQGLDPDTPAPLAPLLRQWMRDGRVRGSVHSGQWQDIGTPERLAEINARCPDSGTY
ncbi:MAG: nucleotidyltransferase family protein [Gammaproteobacteria bacterium]|nr:MAG: nucleotidyltransferase family protein [Gammaproteobacteria bacterium]